jgi:glycosyltransferase involved in cell wall biosynthesis
MKLTVVYPFFESSKSPGHSSMFEVLQGLADHGHEITVISGETGYMKSIDSALPWYKRIIRRESVGGVSVIRTLSYTKPHRGVWSRIFSYLLFSVSSSWGLIATQKPDIVLASSPPIFPMLTTLLYCRIRNIPFVFEVRDLWPSSIVQMGFLKNKVLIKFMEWIEYSLYNKSGKIIALTQGIKDDVCLRGWSEDKVILNRYGFDSSLIYPDEIGARQIRDKFHWKNKKVVLYFGALGEANNIPVILRAAKHLMKSQDILFVLVGDGLRRLEIEREVSLRGLLNIQILNPVSKTEARIFISAADLCLVTLRDLPVFRGAIPSKMIDYLACGKAVVSGVQGEAKDILDSCGAGITFEPNNDGELSRIILDLIYDKQRLIEMGCGGLAYARENFSIKESIDRIDVLLRSTVKNPVSISK